MERRLIELALEGLEMKRAALAKEIEELRGELASPKPVKAPRRRRRSAASRKAQSRRMKAYWAKKRAGKKARKSAK